MNPTATSAIAGSSLPSPRANPNGPILGGLLAAAFVQIYAGLQLTGLWGDGAYCLRSMLSTRFFACIEPPRRVVQWLIELPTLVGIRLGITDLYAISAIYSLSLQLLPLALAGACYFILPPPRRSLFVLPALHYFAGSSSVASIGLHEGPAAAACFWVLFCLVLSVSERASALVLLVLAALPALLLHEVMALLAPALAGAAWWRARRATTSIARVTFRALTVFFLIVAVAQVAYVIYPHNAANRDGFVTQFFLLRWLVSANSGLNVPATLGLLAMASVLATGILPRHRITVLIIFAVSAAVLVAAAWHSAWFLAPLKQFYARNHPAIVSLPLAIFALIAVHRPAPLHHLATRATGQLVLVLAAATLAVQIAAMRDWTSYVAALRDLLQQRVGLIRWETLERNLPPEQRQLFSRMQWGWTNPDLSLLLAPDGQVRSVLTNPTTTGWQPWNPADPAQWPRSRFFDAEGFQSEAGLEPGPARR